MSAFLDTISQVVQDIILTIGYPGIALIMFVETVFPPIPSEVVMPFAGFLVAEGELNLIGALVASTLGAGLGATFIYYVSKWAEGPIIRAFIRRWGKWLLLEETDIDRSLAFFSKYGDIAVFTGRMMPGIRSLISVPAGMNKMPLPRFLVLTFLGTLLWNTILGVAGMVVGANWDSILLIIDDYEKVIYVLIGLGLAYFVVRRVTTLIKRRQQAEAQPAAEADGPTA